MIVLITGATGGYGRALCQQAKDAGHFVIAIGRSIEKLRKLEELDLTDLHYEIDFLDEDIEEKISNLEHALIKSNVRTIDLLINNAGIGSVFVRPSHLARSAKPRHGVHLNFGGHQF